VPLARKAFVAGPAVFPLYFQRAVSSECNADIIAVLAAMVVVMALITFTLHRNSPLVATGPSITPASEPSTTGQRGVVPMRGRRDIER
jgi:hypothetical protein